MQGFSPSLYIKYKALADFQDNAERDVGISRSDMQKLHSTFTSLIEHELEKGDFAMHYIFLDAKAHACPAQKPVARTHVVVAVFGHAKFEELKERFSDLLNQLQSMVATPWSNPAAVVSF